MCERHLDLLVETPGVQNPDSSRLLTAGEEYYINVRQETVLVSPRSYLDEQRSLHRTVLLWQNVVNASNANPFINIWVIPAVVGASTMAHRPQGYTVPRIEQDVEAEAEKRPGGGGDLPQAGPPTRALSCPSRR